MIEQDFCDEEYENITPSFLELNNLRVQIQREIARESGEFDQNKPTSFIDAEESSDLYDLHTQITSIIGLFHLEELFKTIDVYAHTHHADFIEGLQGVINPTNDDDDTFFVQLEDWDYDYNWNNNLQDIRKKVNCISLETRIKLLEKLRKQILRRMDKAIEFWGRSKERLVEKLSSPENIINYMNHFLLVQSFEEYDRSMIFSKQLRSYIKARPFFPAITSEEVFNEIFKLDNIAETHGFEEVRNYLNSFLDWFD
ncbi:MAG: hypothetical protein GOP50_11710 [Candidatus Heimdallarchaeota archaeon]|nr:hypothetical protein [Candidatus Heimdallarchaeota archaeon]